MCLLTRISELTRTSVDRHHTPINERGVTSSDEHVTSLRLHKQSRAPADEVERPASGSADGIPWSSVCSFSWSIQITVDYI